jgi:hypothetical protein
VGVTNRIRNLLGFLVSAVKAAVLGTQGSNSNLSHREADGRRHTRLVRLELDGQLTLWTGVITAGVFGAIINPSLGLTNIYLSEDRPLALIGVVLPHY